MIEHTFPALSYLNKELLASEQECSCYYCCKVLSTIQLTEWTDNGYTALCPYCHVDAIVPGNIDEALLHIAHKNQFGNSRKDTVDISKNYDILTTSDQQQL